MIKATFVKATPTKEGITYILQGPRTKDALRVAADFDDEVCTIELAADIQDAVTVNKYLPAIHYMEALEKNAYEQGKTDEQAKWQQPEPPLEAA